MVTECKEIMGEMLRVRSVPETEDAAGKRGERGLAGRMISPARSPAGDGPPRLDFAEEDKSPSAQSNRGVSR